MKGVGNRVSRKAEEPAEDLQAFLDRRVVQAYETGPVAEIKAWVGRNRTTAAVVAAASFLLIAGLAVFLVIQHSNLSEIFRLSDIKRLADYRAEAATCPHRSSTKVVKDAMLQLGLTAAGDYSADLVVEIRDEMVIGRPDWSVETTNSLDPAQSVQIRWRVTFSKARTATKHFFESEKELKTILRWIVRLKNG